MNEKIFEPALTGFSYSFTNDGYYEEAYYRAVSNRASMIAKPSSIDASSKLLSSHGSFVPARHRTMAARHIYEKRKWLSHTDAI